MCLFAFTDYFENCSTFCFVFSSSNSSFKFVIPQASSIPNLALIASFKIIRLGIISRDCRLFLNFCKLYFSKSIWYRLLICYFQSRPTVCLAAGAAQTLTRICSEPIPKFAPLPLRRSRVWCNLGWVAFCLLTETIF